MTEYREIPVDQNHHTQRSTLKNEKSLLNIWNYLKGTSLLKTHAKQTTVDCWDDYGVFVSFTEHPTNNKKYVIAGVTDLKQEYRFVPPDELLNATGDHVFEPTKKKKTTVATAVNKKDERHYNNFLAKKLRVEGWAVQPEYKLSKGRIDIYATKENGCRIYEIKTDNSYSTISRALGQVLSYKEQMTTLSPSCFIALPNAPLDGSCLELLDKFGVQLAVLEGA